MFNLLNRTENPPKAIRLDDVIEQNSTEIINFLGYTLLALALLDSLAIFIPTKLLNPVWEFQTIGRLVDISWAFLLGLILVFYRRQESIVKQNELRLLSLISWLTLVMAIAYFLMFPLLISNSIRLSNNNSNRANQQLTANSAQIQQIEEKLGQATEAELNNLIASFPDPNVKLELSPQQFKEKLLTENTSKFKVAKQQIKQALKQQQRELYKNTIKWAIGAILTGASAFFIWKSTRWARVLRVESD